MNAFIQSIQRLAIIGTVIVVLSSAIGFAGRFHWFADLFSHFRAQYAVFLALGSLLFLLYRNPVFFFVSTSFCALNLVALYPYCLENSVSVSEGDYRLMLHNVNTDLGSPLRLLGSIDERDPCFIVLCETDFRWIEALQSLHDEYPYFIEHPRGDNFGIALYSKHPIRSHTVSFFSPARVPSIVANIESMNSALTIIATHPLPPAGAEYSSDRNRHLVKLAETVLEIDGNIIVAGDLNTTNWNYHFRKLIGEGKLVDSMAGFGMQPSWPAGVFPLYIPLDHVLYRGDIKVANREIGPSSLSDHFSIFVDFSVMPKHRNLANPDHSSE